MQSLFSTFTAYSQQIVFKGGPLTTFEQKYAVIYGTNMANILSEIVLKTSAISIRILTDISYDRTLSKVLIAELQKKHVFATISYGDIIAGSIAELYHVIESIKSISPPVVFLLLPWESADFVLQTVSLKPDEFDNNSQFKKITWITLNSRQILQDHMFVQNIDFPTMLDAKQLLNW